MSCFSWASSDQKIHLKHQIWEMSNFFEKTEFYQPNRRSIHDEEKKRRELENIMNFPEDAVLHGAVLRKIRYCFWALDNFTDRWYIHIKSRLFIIPRSIWCFTFSIDSLLRNTQNYTFCFKHICQHLFARFQKMRRKVSAQNFNDLSKSFT